MPSRKWTVYGAIIVAAIVVLFVVARRRAAASYERFLGGMWVGDPRFLREAGLTDMQLYLEPGPGPRRDGYLIMTDGAGRFVANHPVALTCSAGLRARGAALTAPVAIADLSEGAIASLFPDDLRMTLSRDDLTLTLFNGEKVFAHLFKDAAATQAAAAAAAS